MTDRHTHERAAALRDRLAALEDERRSLQNELVSLERRVPLSRRDALTPAVTAASRAPEKIALFRRLFVGRDDVFPLRWHNPRTAKSGYAPACSNEWKPGLCRKPQVKCGECPNQAFIALSDAIVRRHLGGSNEKSSDGDFVAGVYPLLPDSTCRFLAVDFDGDDWSSDATAYLETCHTAKVTAALERSRSGAGGHVWIFFSEPVPANLARQIGSFLLTETMERRPEIGFASYDRLFPSQDTMPLGGFGNLIALPLQRRARQRGNSVFIDADLHAYDDQWAFLSSLSPMSLMAIERIVESAEKAGRVVGVRMPVEDDGADEPWLASPSRRASFELVARRSKARYVLGLSATVARRDLDALIEEAIIDANGVSEQRVGFYTMLEEHLAVPFDVELLGITVAVERIGMTDDERLVAICRRGRFRQAISLGDLLMPTRLPHGAEWIAAYRRWARWQ